MEKIQICIRNGTKYRLCGIPKDVRVKAASILIKKDAGGSSVKFNDHMTAFFSLLFSTISRFELSVDDGRKWVVNFFAILLPIHICENVTAIVQAFDYETCVFLQGRKIATWKGTGQIEKS